MKEKVSKLCRLLDLSAEELAERLGVKRQLVLNWMTGRVRESPKSLVLENSLRALQEGFSREFVLDCVLVSGPVSFQKVQRYLEGDESSRSGLRILESDKPAGDSKKSLLGDIEQASREAFDKGHYIQSALILFQAIETLLRIVIKTYGQKKGISDLALTEAADREQSFLRLTLHLDLVYPENSFSESLRQLNRRRNDTMHRLFFEFESRDEMEGKLKEFCLEARLLRDTLAREVHSALKK
jgi:transcriptional regulator with XRE-family HTH domain